ncbi:NAD(P)/FAD-dependent oxidoreductase [Microbacterium sp. gxy059]|uniref:NAD(P)/FAD-dependent oxidoreductase n=1 Tax=Microbacterium sp. gxy059 TaxID=2957199 RepID=UPI003D97341E
MSSASVVVIGGGIAGATTAFSLARRGADVALVDDGGAGQATAASAGIIAPWVSSVEGPFYDVYAAGGGFYPEYLSRLSGLGIPELGYRRSGALVVADDDAQLDRTADRVTARVREAGDVAGEVRRLDAASARELFPALAEDLSGVLVTGGGRVDGRTLRDASVTGARMRGATTVTDAVVSVEQRAGGGWRVTTLRTHLDADAVVVAAGARIVDLLSRLGVRVGISPQRGQIIHLALRGVNTSPWPTIHPLSDHYMTPFDGGRIAVGATRETGSGFDARVTAGGQFDVLRKALGVAPGLRDATFLETRVGIRPMSDTGIPQAGAVPGADGLWMVGGYGAAGLTMGPLLGDAIARSVLGEPAAELARTPVVVDA